MIISREMTKCKSKFIKAKRSLDLTCGYFPYIRDSYIEEGIKRVA